MNALPGPEGAGADPLRLGTAWLDLTDSARFLGENAAGVAGSELIAFPRGDPAERFRGCTA